MHWILQTNLFDEAGYDALVQQLERFDIPYSVHKVVPFVGDLIPEPELDTSNVICMGSYSMRHIAKKKGWYPGVFDLEPFDFRVQLEHWGTEMLNHDSVVSRFEDCNFDEEYMFLRPIHDSKSFAGRVFSKQEFYDWKRQVCVLEQDDGSSLDKDTLIQMCYPKTIYAEYRFWIVGQKIVTASLYKRGGRVIYSSEVDKRIYDYVTQILRTKDQKENILLSTSNHGWAPQPAFVLDVAETDEGMKVVEINTLNSAGFYAGDMQKLVMALEGAFNGKQPRVP